MFLLKQILPAAIVALMVAAGVCGLALWSGKGRTRDALCPLAMGVAYLSGQLVITGCGSFPPTDTTNWLPYFALATALLGATYGMLALKPSMRALILAVVSAVALRLLLKPKFQYGWSPAEGWLWVACLVCALVLLAMILDALARRTAIPIEMPAFLLVVSAGTSGGLMLSGSVLLGQFAAVLTAAVFGTLVLTIRRVNLSRGI